MALAGRAVKELRTLAVLLWGWTPAAAFVLVKHPRGCTCLIDAYTVTGFERKCLSVGTLSLTRADALALALAVGEWLRACLSRLWAHAFTVFGVEDKRLMADHIF